MEKIKGLFECRIVKKKGNRKKDLNVMFIWIFL